MANNYVFNDSLPVAPLEITALESCQELASRVSGHIVQFRRNGMEKLMRCEEDLHYHGYDADSYLLPCSRLRFGTGEGKVVIDESVRGTDAFMIVDVMNYNIPYVVSGYANHMPPGDHFQDLKRVTGACVSTIHRVDAIMPFLCGSRQHKCSKRESPDCAMGLEELAAMGVENIITFDAHDPRVQNATPPIGFDNFMPTYQLVKSLSAHDSSIQIDKEHPTIISPDKGAMNRAVYLASNLGVDMGMFHRHRDYPQIINGRNSIVVHEFLGAFVEGKTAPTIDDMTPPGESMLDICRELKERKTGKVIVYCTFGLLINDLGKFDEFYTQGYLGYVITTNLNYRNQDLLKREWYLEADMSKHMAAIINALNHDRSISASLFPMEKIQRLMQKYQNGGHECLQKLV